MFLKVIGLNLNLILGKIAMVIVWHLKFSFEGVEALALISGVLDALQLRFILDNLFFMPTHNMNK